MNPNLREFADYTRYLNAAAGDASARLRAAHREEYDRYLCEQMDALGFTENPKRSEVGQRRFIRKAEFG
jgi:hypothetical protein